MTSPITIDGIGNIIVRPYQPSDEAFVMRSWLNTARDQILRKRNDKFYRWFRPLVELHVAEDEMRVACLEEQPTVILSYACIRNSRPVFAYTATDPNVPMRGRGLMRALTEMP